MFTLLVNRSVSYRLISLLTVALIVGLAATPVWATATQDSTTWEGSYEANVLPWAAGWSGGPDTVTTQYTAATIRMDTLDLDIGAIHSRTDANLNFTTGATVEIKTQVLDAASHRDGSGLRMFSEGSGLGNDYAVFAGFMGDGTLWIVNNGATWNQIAVSTTSEHTYRFSLLTGASNFKVYLDGGATPIYTSTLTSFGDDADLLFGDMGSTPDGDWKIDYIRWTNQGAFAPVPEPATGMLLLLAGLVGLLAYAWRRRK